VRIPGVLLRTPVTITTEGESTGDGPGAGDMVNVRGQVKRSVKITNDQNGQTISVWATIRLRPTVRVGGRAPQAGDTVTVQDVARTVASVEPVQGPGTAVAYLELIAGDG
jgi:hypothetical protein